MVSALEKCGGTKEEAPPAGCSCPAAVPSRHDAVTFELLMPAPPGSRFSTAMKGLPVDEVRDMRGRTADRERSMEEAGRREGRKKGGYKMCAWFFSL